MTQLVDKYKLDPMIAKAVIEGVASRAYSLLLGAGASYGVEGGDGKVIKGAVDLALEVNATLSLGLEPPDSQNLGLVFGDASQPSHVARLHRLLSQRFTGCKPTWQRVLHDFNWKRIWSLNIDDVVERARSPGGGKRLSIFNWTDEFKPRDRGEGDLQIVHLHGLASRLSGEPNSLIFSLKEYAARSEMLPGWHSEFRSEYSQKPFIVCGARLQDEYDLISVLEFGNRSQTRGGAPSLIVLPSFAAGQVERLARFGLIAIPAYGEEFFKALSADIAEHLRASRFMDPEVVAGRNELRSAYRLLETGTSTLSIKRKVLDFYASAEANWSHICQNLDAPLSGAQSIVDWMLEPDPAIAKVALITGGPISGKSATLLRAGYEMLSRGREVWHFRGEQLFDETSVVKYLKPKQQAVLLMDDCADFSASIRKLVNEAQKIGARIRIVAAVESNRRRAVRGDAVGANVKEFPQEPLSKDDFLRIFSKRSEKARLGSATGTTPIDGWRSFKDTFNYKLLEWLEALENANDYRDAIQSILTSSSGANITTKNLLAATAVVQRFGYSLPFFMLSSLSKGQAIEPLTDEGGILFDVAYLDARGLRLRNSAFAKFVWSQFSVAEKFDWSINIAKRVAPLVVPLSVTNRTIPYLIIRNLMAWETVRADVGDNAETWYSALESAYGWNARFWEQRALLASETGHDPKAYSYAKKAVAIHGKDPFPHTTLGKICLKIAVARDDQVGIDRFWEGVTSLERSRQISAAEGLEWEHPYVTFFSYALKVAKLNSFGAQMPRLASAWKDWMQGAETSTAFLDQSREGFMTLGDYQRQWLLTAAIR